MQDEKQRERLQALAKSPNTLEDERVLCKLLASKPPMPATPVWRR